MLCLLSPACLKIFARLIAILPSMFVSFLGNQSLSLIHLFSSQLRHRKMTLLFRQVSLSRDVDGCGNGEEDSRSRSEHATNETSGGYHNRLVEEFDRRRIFRACVFLSHLSNFCVNFVKISFT